ncbi:MAG: porin [Chromatiales bacterium]
MSVSRISIGSAILLLGLVGTSGVSTAEEDPWESALYSLGHGLNFPQQRLTLGGYLDLHLSDLEQQRWNLSLRSLSLFISKSFQNRWHFFTELELGDALEISADGSTSEDAELDLERLYLDYRQSREFTLRVGKYLTPVGRWNLIHAAPLVWTPDRPLTTAAPFARHATGLMLYGDTDIGSNSLDYTLYGDNSEQLDPTQEQELAFEDDRTGLSPLNAFDWAVGGQLVYHFADDTAQFGLSYLRSQMEDLDYVTDLFGADLYWNVGSMEFSFEGIYRKSPGQDEPDVYGGFVQAVLPLTKHLYFVGRHENYRAAIQEDTALIDCLGLTYRPNWAISLKLEYRGGSNNEILAPSGWLGSLAILF